MEHTKEEPHEKQIILYPVSILFFDSRLYLILPVFSPKVPVHFFIPFVNGKSDERKRVHTMIQAGRLALFRHPQRLTGFCAAYGSGSFTCVAEVGKFSAFSFW